MSHDLATLFLVGLGYLGLLFLLAHHTDKGNIPARWVSHPLTYTLSLGVYATSWSYYGSVGYAHDHGFMFLTIYLGVTLAFILSPVLLQPILRLTRDYQLTSLADLLAFRYRSQAVGVLITLFMLFGTLPYIALQIRAVAESMHVLTQEAPPNLIALVFCITLTLFAVLFGARHLSSREKHRGLVAAIAFESLIKLLVFLAIGFFALTEVFEDTSGLAAYLQRHPEALQALYAPVGESPWNALIFLSFGAAFLLPRQFHMLFAENLDPRALRTASWALPLFLLLLNLPIPVILWGGQYLQLDMHPDYFVLGITLVNGPSWLSLLAFIGGLSAASAMVIITSLALASMSLNHLLLPLAHPDPAMNLYRWILWGRRILIALVIMAGYLVYVSLQHKQGLVQLGLISFVAVAQFLPGIVGLLYWRRATRWGFVAGLLAGAAIWAVTLIAPLMHQSGMLLVEVPIEQWVTWSGMNKWAFATFATVGMNGLLFVLVSLATRQSPGETDAAHACCSDWLVPLEGVVAADSPADFRVGLAETLGKPMAEREVDQALADLNMHPGERRSNELRRLRERIERNLSGLLGPQLAHMIVNRRLVMDHQAKNALADSMHYVEERLEASRSQLQGLSIELDNLRRLHRQILQDLPLGVCALDHEGRIVLWNLALEIISDLPTRHVAGSQLETLPAPWGELLSGFARAGEQHVHRMQVVVAGKPHWYNLHKSLYAEPDRIASDSAPGMVMIIEDLTDLGQLEAELTHSDRLASIGRLAAGVAHEIGNPVTGIASLAQNLREESDPQLVRESVEDIIAQTRRIANILKTLQSFSRGGLHLAQYETFPLCEVIGESLHLIELTHKHRRIHFDTHCPGGIRLTGSRQQLSQVLVNLLNNAVDASPDGEQVATHVTQQDQQVDICIDDHGSGIPKDLQETVFEPFYTTKPTGQGTGLGLSLAHRIVEELGGRLTIEELPHPGTRMRISLPLQAPVNPS